MMVSAIPANLNYSCRRSNSSRQQAVIQQTGADRQALLFIDVRRILCLMAKLPTCGRRQLGLDVRQEGGRRPAALRSTRLVLGDDDRGVAALGALLLQAYTRCKS